MATEASRAQRRRSDAVVCRRTRHASRRSPLSRSASALNCVQPRYLPLSVNASFCGAHRTSIMLRRNCLFNEDDDSQRDETSYPRVPRVPERLFLAANTMLILGYGRDCLVPALKKAGSCCWHSSVLRRRLGALVNVSQPAKVHHIPVR